MSDTPLELLFIGLALCGAGAALLLGRKNRLVLAYGQRITSTDAAARRWVTFQAGLLLAGGSLLVVTTVVGSLMQRDPRPAIQAQASLTQALVQPAPSGYHLHEAATAAVYGHAQGAFEARNVVFTAQRESQVCAVPVPRCAVGNPDRLVRAWGGQLTWEERRRPGANWHERVCPATVTLLASGAWEVDIHGNRCNPPAPS